MTSFKIPLVNTYLKIEINQVPKVEKLKKELSDFFDNHDIDGITIKSFKIDEHFNIYPNLDGKKLSGDKDYGEEINNIGKRYCINNLQFALSCYGK